MRLFVMAMLLFGSSCVSFAQEKKPPSIEDSDIDSYSVTIEFDRPMQTWSGKAQPSNIKITPAIDCQWTWEDDNALACYADDDTDSIKPATRYKIDIGPGFKSQEGVPLAARTLNLETEGPEVRATIIDWTKGNPNISLSTELPVSVDAVREKLQVSINGKPIPFDLLENKRELDEDEEDTGSVFTLRYPASNEENALLSLTMKPGLKSRAGPVAGKQTGEFLLAKLNAAFKLNEITCTNNQRYTKTELKKIKTGAVKCDPGTAVMLGFSNVIDSASLLAFSKSLPKGFTIKKQEDTTGNYYYYNSKVPAEAKSVFYELNDTTAGTQYLLQYPTDFASGDGKRIEQSTKILLDFGDYAEAFTVKPGVKTQLPGEKDITYLEVMNSSLENTKFDYLNIADSMTAGEIVFPLAHEKNRKLTLDMPLPSTKVQTTGGLMLAGSQEIKDLGFSFAYVPFNVLHAQSQNQVLVWATDWKTGKPVANAKVEIIRIDKAMKLHIAASGTTDADGVSEIVFDFKQVLPEDRMSLIRVYDGQRVVVTPALFRSGSLLGFGETYAPWHYQRSIGRETFTFGVTELPLYRPGETVNYRLWQREKINNHLRIIQPRGTVALQLKDNKNQRTLQTWQANLDANGSVAANLSLSQLLPDGIYCITSKDSDEREDGACFQLARFEAQPLWAKLQSDKQSVLSGQNLQLDFDSGYFSGGPAAQLDLRFHNLSTPQRFESVYTEFRDYRFIDPSNDGGRNRGVDILAGKTTPTKTGGNGDAIYKLPLDKPVFASDGKTPIAFGLLEFSAEVSIPGKASASSGTVAVQYSHYQKFIGLKTRDWWLRQDQDPGLQAVVVAYDGKAIPGESMTVSIFRVLKDNKESLVAECKLVSGQASPCAFRAKDAGYYVFRAQGNNAASTELRRYIGSSYHNDPTDEGPEASLVLVKASDGKSNARVRIIQPFARAVVLFTLEYDSIVRHWVQTIDDANSEIEVPVKSEWAPGLSLRAIIRPANATSAAAAKQTATLEAELDLDIPRLDSGIVSAATSKKTYRPDEEIEILVTNSTSIEKHVTMSVIDDSVYQQGSQIWDTQNPGNDNWIGVLKKWDVSFWYGFETWQYADNIFYKELGKEKNSAPTEKDGRNQPVQVVTRADLQKTGLASTFDLLNPVDGNRRSQPVVFQRKARERDKNGLPEIDAVEVVGSRIKRTSANRTQDNYVSIGCDTCSVVQVTGAKLKEKEPFPRSPTANLILDRAKNNPGKPMPRVRSQFVDAAYWNPDLVLGPGQSKTIKFKLPDNLTQWRVLLWASDSSDGFSLTQATFDTNLPIEVRAGLPTRLYVGDRSSVQVSARNQSDAESAMTINTAVSGAGVALNKSEKAVVKPYVAVEQYLSFTTTMAGDLDVLSVADSEKETDGLSSGAMVQSRYGNEEIVQSGWLDLNQINLTIPGLPDTAIESKIDLQVTRGFDAWTDGWLKDLQEYPHRCWEQTLSRAIGAAYAQAYDGESNWSDRKITINDALQAASSFQDDDGYFRYFQNQTRDSNSEPNLVLSAYTLKGFRYLQSLGYPVSEDLVDELNKKLPGHLKYVEATDRVVQPETSWETLATIAGAIENPAQLDTNSLAALWDNWDKLSWFARAELVQAMTRKPEFSARAAQGVQRLRLAGEQRGLSQLIADSRDFSYYMGSNLRDQCAVVGTLFKLDKTEEGRAARERLLRGVYDLYAGGTASLDTQSSAQCLMALHDVTRQSEVAKMDANITVALAKKAQTLSFAAEKREVRWQSALEPSLAGNTLALTTDKNAGGTMNYSAVISYQYDLQQAEARGVGLNVQRHYDVLQNGKWVPLPKTGLREGDWVRIRLEVTAPKERHFVAVSDFVPGGLVTRDITLSSVGGADVKNIGDNGSYYFDSRQTGASVVRIYAEYLPAGRHEIYYYAQAVHPGDYFAPPAVAELMYGRASRANTSADRVTVQASP